MYIYQGIIQSKRSDISTMLISDPFSKSHSDFYLLFAGSMFTFLPFI